MTDYTALITGGSKGIGADLGQRLLERGYRVISLARNVPDWSHENLEHVAVDLLDADAVSSRWLPISPRDMRSRISFTMPG